MRTRIIYFGPPGTGKTRTLLQRLEEALQQGISPERIAFLTFTRRAELEALTRVNRILKLATDELPYFHTLHSMAFRALELKSTDLVSPAHLADLGETLGTTFNIHTQNLQLEGNWNCKEGTRMLALDNYARLRGLTSEQAWNEARAGADLTWDRFKWFVDLYQTMKQEQGLVDFTDILLRFVRAQIRLPVDVAFIDEAQDLSSLQWLVALQAVEAASLQYIAGDDDQEIYRWAGADATFFINLEAQRTVLHQSYRLPRRIHALATKVLMRIHHRVPKDFQPRDAEGSVGNILCANYIQIEKDEPWLWLVRNRYLIPDLLFDLRRRNLVYSQHGNSSIREDERAAIYSWERLEHQKTISGADAKNLYSFLKGNIQIEYGHKALKDIQLDGLYNKVEMQSQFGLRVSGPWFDVLELVPIERRLYYRSLLRAHGTLMLNPQVEVDTIHGSKGAECDNVALFLERSLRVYKEAATNNDAEERVWYVGATRAKERLLLVCSGNPWGYRGFHQARGAENAVKIG